MKKAILLPCLLLSFVAYSQVNNENQSSKNNLQSQPPVQIPNEEKPSITGYYKILPDGTREYIKIEPINSSKKNAESINGKKEENIINEENNITQPQK